MTGRFDETGVVGDGRFVPEDPPTGSGILKVKLAGRVRMLC
jgi:hypothetical protein